jgi:hypothetical protein
VDFGKGVKVRKIVYSQGEEKAKEEDNWESL